MRQLIVKSQGCLNKNHQSFLTILSYQDILQCEISMDNPLLMYERECIRYLSCPSFNCFNTCNIFCFCRNKGSIIEDVGPQVFLALFQHHYCSFLTISFEERCTIELHNVRMIQPPEKEINYTQSSIT